MAVKSYSLARDGNDQISKKLGNSGAKTDLTILIDDDLNILQKMGSFGFL